MVACDSFKEARKEGRKIAGHFRYAHIGRVTKGELKGKWLVDMNAFAEEEFYVHRDGRVCKISDLEELRKKYERKGQRPVPFFYGLRNREPDESKKDFNKSMAIGFHKIR